MPPTSTFTSFSPAATPGDNQRPVGTGYQRGLPFWPILFGGLSFCLTPPHLLDTDAGLV